MTLRWRTHLRRDDRRSTTGDSRRQTLNDDVEDWRQEQAEQRDTEHAGEDGDAHGLTHFEARPRRQYGPQSGAARIKNRGAARHAIALALPRELHNQNRVLAREAGQHEKADLRE